MQPSGPPGRSVWESPRSPRPGEEGVGKAHDISCPYQNSWGCGDLGGGSQDSRGPRGPTLRTSVIRSRICSCHKCSSSVHTEVLLPAWGRAARGTRRSVSGLSSGARRAGSRRTSYPRARRQDLKGRIICRRLCPPPYYRTRGSRCGVLSALLASLFSVSSFVNPARGQIPSWGRGRGAFNSVHTRSALRKRCSGVLSPGCGPACPPLP